MGKEKRESGHPGESELLLEQRQVSGEWKEVGEKEERWGDEEQGRESRSE